MPIYEYECEKCKKIFEEIQSINDKSLKECPVCGGKLNRKFPSGMGFVFNGKGFYSTDYKRKEEKNEIKNGKPKNKRNN